VPVLNGEDTIAETISSIQAQTLQDFEIIVVDNGSTDRTRQIVKKTRGIRYFYLKEKGRSKARNFGARQASGNYLAFVDADVALTRDWLECANRYMRKFPLHGLATRIRPCGNSKAALDRFRNGFGRWKSRDTFLSLASHSGARPLINTAACLFEKNAFDLVRGFDESLIRNEDLDLSMRLFCRGFFLGGCSKANAFVYFANGRGTTIREGLYLKRAAEVRFFSLSEKRKEILNFAMLRNIWQKNECWKTLGFACLVEVAGSAGELSRLMRNREARHRKWQVRPGMNLLAGIFSHDRKKYVLKQGHNFLFLDDESYICEGTSPGKRLGTGESAALKKLCAGLPITPRECAALVNTMAFSAFPM
jgi:glycosyltransferase involved in cell wall biosynthesis